jgi:hypothetical protein
VACLTAPRAAAFPPASTRTTGSRSTPSDLAGVRPRRYYRASSGVEAESFADAIISLGRGPLQTHYTEPAFTAMKAFITHLQSAGGPEAQE